MRYNAFSRQGNILNKEFLDQDIFERKKQQANEYQKELLWQIAQNQANKQRLIKQRTEQEKLLEQKIQQDLQRQFGFKQEIIQNSQQIKADNKNQKLKQFQNISALQSIPLQPTRQQELRKQMGMNRVILAAKEYQNKSYVKENCYNRQDTYRNRDSNEVTDMEMFRPLKQISEFIYIQ